MEHNSNGHSTADAKGHLKTDDTQVSPFFAEKQTTESITKVDVQSKSKQAQKESSKDARRRPSKQRSNAIWIIKITVIALVLGAFFSFISDLTASSTHIAITLLLLIFLILCSILFDGIGVATTTCDEAPIASMAARKVYGAKTALKLVKNGDKVSSICNDVIGDIFGIISGSCSAAIILIIVLKLGDSGQVWQQWLTIGVTSLVSALTIGGKAFLKNIAINNSKEFVMLVARVLAPFSKDERALYKKLRRKSELADKKSADDKQANNDVAVEAAKGQSATATDKTHPKKNG